MASTDEGLLLEGELVGHMIPLLRHESTFQEINNKNKYWCFFNPT